MKLNLIFGAVILAMTGALYYFVTENAKSQQVAESYADAMGKYATQAESEIADHVAVVEILSKEYQKTRDERDAANERLDGANLDKLAKERPDWLATHATTASNRLFMGLENITRRSRSSNDNKEVQPPRPD